MIDNLSLFIDRRLLLSDSGLVESRGGGEDNCCDLSGMSRALFVDVFVFASGGSVFVNCVLLSGVHVVMWKTETKPTEDPNNLNIRKLSY